jgi:hypothetical protein
MDNSSKKRKRKRILVALIVAAWLFLLGFISYCVCLPNLKEASASLKAIREDPNLTPEQKVEKMREIYAKLTPSQGRQVFQNDKKKWHHEQNREMQAFLKMSPEEQVAYVKKMEEERKKLGPKGAFFIGGAIKGGPGGAGDGGKVGPSGPGSGMVSRAVGGPGGKGAIFFGPAGAGGPGGGPPKPNPNQMQKSMLDDISPETRAGQSYQKGLSK